MAIYLMRKGSLWRCSRNISLGLNPRTYLDGDYSSSSRDVGRPGRSAEEKRRAKINGLAGAFLHRSGFLSTFSVSTDERLFFQKMRIHMGGNECWNLSLDFCLQFSFNLVFLVI